MGIDVHTFEYLAANRALLQGQNVVTIGRQTMYVPLPQATALVERGSGAADGDSLSRMIGASFPYAEGALQALGAASVDSMDVSDYERATLIHDMNEALPRELEERFGVVFDGGSLEHIFNVPVALSNMIRMLKPGGVFIGVYPANNFMGHGFYQFSPELFFRVFDAPNGCAVIDMRLYETRAASPFYRVPDPKSVQRRVELVNAAPTHLVVAARRERVVEPFTARVYQSDYEHDAWGQKLEASEGASHAKNGVLRSPGVLDKLRLALPLSVRNVLSLARLMIRNPWSSRVYERIDERRT